MPAELSMNGRKKIESIQKEFTEKFNYLTLLFLDDNRKSLDITRSLAEVRTKKGTDVSINAGLKVNTLEARFMDSYGLLVEVAYMKNGKVLHTKDNVDKTLNEMNRWCEENGCEPFGFKKSKTGETVLSQQEQLFNVISEQYPDAVAKKMNKDNFMDVHLPAVNSKKGTHIFFNTAKEGIKFGFYCRDEEFVKSVLDKSSNIEQYAQGVRPAGNPLFTNVEEAAEAALDFIREMMGENSLKVGEENSSFSNNDSELKLEEVLKKIKSFSSKDKFKLIQYINTPQEWIELYTANIKKNSVYLKLTRRFSDSFWTLDISKQDLIDEIEIYLEELNLDNSFQLDWKFYKEGEGANEVDIEIVDYDENKKFPLNCYSDENKDLGLDPYKIFELYNPTLDDEETLEFGSIKYIDIFHNNDLLLRIPNPNSENSIEEADDEAEEQSEVDKIIKLNAQNASQLLEEIKNNKNQKSFKIKCYTKEYSDLTYVLNFKVQKSIISINRVNWSNDSYWSGEISKKALVEALSTYVENLDMDDLIDNHFHSSIIDYQFDGCGDLDNGFDYNFIAVDPELITIPEEFQDEDGDFNILRLADAQFPENEELTDKNIGTFSYYQIIIDGKIYELNVDDINEDDDEDEIDEEEQKLNELLQKYGVESESELTSITAEQAREFLNYKGSLYLSGLTSLTDKSAKILAKFQGDLWLDALKYVSDKAVSYLFSHSGGCLSLDGLESLSDQVLDSLEKHNELLCLSGLTTINEKTAKSLARHYGSLNLNGLTAMSEKLLEIISTHKGGFLSLGGLTQISEKEAEILSNHNGALYLEGIKSLSDNSAKYLSKVNGGLSLDCLKFITEKGIEFLSYHIGGSLSLNGLESLSDKSSLALSKYKGYLYLNGLTTLSEKSALAFSKFEGQLCMNSLSYLSEIAADLLAQKGIFINEEMEGDQIEDD